jgi:uridylate kinase
MITYPFNTLENKKVIISLGGSLIAPNGVDIAYLQAFRKFIFDHIELGFSFVIITGGGGPAREYIESATAILDNDLTNDDKDWLGIHATRFNGHLLRTIFRSIAQVNLITNPEVGKINLKKKVVVGAGWKPGWSTDFVANKIAQRYEIPVVINLSNVKQVYTADPKKDPTAQAIEDMSWPDFRKIVGEEWIPGMNVPYDPIAARLADSTNTTVLVMDGKNLDNLRNCFEGKEFMGTMLHN